MIERLLATLLVLCTVPARAAGPLVLQTDFGTRDGAVAAMRGVAVGIDANVRLHDLSHDNTPFHVWEAAYRLNQAAPYWPRGTVFVSVVDPGVGTDRRAVVVATRSGHFFVGPDNGTWTLIAETLGVEAVREIDPARHSRPGSDRSYTFHGRDLFVVAGAKLATDRTSFDEIGPLQGDSVVRIPYERARLAEGVLSGGIPYLDFQYGNVWTGIDEALLTRLGVKHGDRVQVRIREGGREVYAGILPYARTFGDVPKGEPLLYLNSLMQVALALNQGNFAEAHGIGFGGDWSICLEAVK